MPRVTVEPAYTELASWMLKFKDAPATYQQIALKIRDVQRAHEREFNEDSIGYQALGSWISKARQYLEVHNSLTIINVRGVGYKIANPPETAVFAMKTVKRTVVLAERTKRLSEIVDRKYIPYAFKKVFQETEGGVQYLTRRARKFLEAFTNEREGENGER